MTAGGEQQIRPLVRDGAGRWRSRDGRWTFLRHFGDPHPQRWFVYLDDDEDPVNVGGGETTLGAVVRLVEREGAKMIEEDFDG